MSQIKECCLKETEAKKLEANSVYLIIRRRLLKSRYLRLIVTRYRAGIMTLYSSLGAIKLDRDKDAGARGKERERQRKGDFGGETHAIPRMK